MSTFVLRRPKVMHEGLPNCGIVALAAVLELPYETVSRAVKQYHSSPRWRGRTNMRVLRRVTTALDGEWSEIRAPRKRLGGWVALNCAQGTPYIIRVRGHIMACYNGMVLDQYECTSAKTHGRKHSIVSSAASVLMPRK